mmetsp:Transcript_19860/g.32651  ORF Transcript_19860/g.32651 Transcript_19860/m.32651 type:complete len:389 (+) Transcript_19860:621-1787(+)
MRRRDDEGIGSSELSWMFESNNLDSQLPAHIAEFSDSSSGRRFIKPKSKVVSKLPTPTSLLIAFAMVLHEAVRKSFSNGIVLVLLIIPPATILFIVFERFEHKAKSRVALRLFYKGFGPGFLLLLVVELLTGVSLFGYYCYSNDCTDTVKHFRDFNGIGEALYRYSPLSGLVFAFIIAFFSAGLLEESTKLFFVSNVVDFVYYPDDDTNQVEMGVLNRVHSSEDSLEAQRETSTSINDRVTDVDVTTLTSRHGIIIYFLAFSMGLATAESMLYVCAFSNNTNSAIRIALSRIFLSLPMHAMCGCLTGLGLISRYLENGLPLYKVLLPAVLLHGSYDFSLILVPVVPAIAALGEPTVEYIRLFVSFLFVLGASVLLWTKLQVYFHESDV